MEWIMANWAAICAFFEKLYEIVKGIIEDYYLITYSFKI